MGPWPVKLNDIPVFSVYVGISGNILQNNNNAKKESRYHVIVILYEEMKQLKYTFLTRNLSQVSFVIIIRTLFF